MKLEMDGFDELSIKCRELANFDVTVPLLKSALIVERDAKILAPVDTGQLRGSIRTGSVADESITVGTNVVYAPYVEYGTGIFSTKGSTHTGYWVYVKGTGGVSTHSAKDYTLKEAKRVMAILRSKGLEAFYTCGRHPKPFLHPALANNRTEILQQFKDYLKSETKI